MRAVKFALILGAVALVYGVANSPTAEAGYYGGWGYYPKYGYYYTRYTYSGGYHYCIHYPSRPRYVYYYNPVRRYYWGRFDTEGTPGKQYSILKEEDRKEKLSDIPEKAFPEPAEMPKDPEGNQIPVPEDIPQGEGE